MADKNETIARFRYGLIAPVIYETVSKQNEYFRELSRKEFEVSGNGKLRFKIGTFKAWLRKYRKHGFEGLFPKKRKDAGVSKKITTSFAVIIEEHLKENEFFTIKELYRQLLRKDKLAGISYQCLKKYVKANGLLPNARPEKGRKRFEHGHINELWICDFLHFIKIKDKKQARKAYICAIIDDHSRVIVGGGIYFSEGSVSIANTLKKAVLTFGLPERFYCDNGSGFISSHLSDICARLKISLIHSEPYDPASRGKIERFFRTVRLKFFPCIREEHDLVSINELFQTWLNEYHNTHHLGINETPFSRYFKDETKTRRTVETEIEPLFFETIKRKVQKDSCVSIYNEEYEVPSKYAGEKIEIRFPQKGEYYLFENNKQVVKLKKINLVENANLPTINFSKLEVKNV